MSPQDPAAPRGRFLITGAEGQLGRALTARFSVHGDVVAVTRHDLDIRDASRVGAVVRDLSPAAILNCAAYNDVDGAEDDAETALAVNALALRGMARAAREAGALLVHYSTDFVFDGAASTPYAETDPTSPQSTYAASKLLGEWFARDAGRYLVLRVESLFGVRHLPGTRRVGSLDRIIDALEQGQAVKAFHDRVVSPSYLPDVADATAHLLGHAAASGLYHVVNSGHATWYEIAEHAAKLLERPADIHRVSTADLQLRAPRPPFAALSNQRLAAAGFTMPSWQDALARYLAFRRGAKSPPPSRQ